MKSPIIIFGSSRSNGNTFDAVQLIIRKIHHASFVDLANYKISDFDYGHQNKNDDFMQVIDQALKHETSLFRNPIFFSYFAIFKNLNGLRLRKYTSFYLRCCNR
jgi:hypothetical protein